MRHISAHQIHWLDWHIRGILSSPPLGRAQSAFSCPDHLGVDLGWWASGRQRECLPSDPASLATVPALPGEATLVLNVAVASLATVTAPAFPGPVLSSSIRPALSDLRNGFVSALLVPETKGFLHVAVL